jgi:hypothetical protein
MLGAGSMPIEGLSETFARDLMESDNQGEASIKPVSSRQGAGAAPQASYPVRSNLPLCSGTYSVVELWEAAHTSDRISRRRVLGCLGLGALILALPKTSHRRENPQGPTCLRQGVTTRPPSVVPCSMIRLPAQAS